jgi:hypothetical protein
MDFAILTCRPGRVRLTTFIFRYRRPSSGDDGDIRISGFEDRWSLRSAFSSVWEPRSRSAGIPRLVPVMTPRPTQRLGRAMNKIVAGSIYPLIIKWTVDVLRKGRLIQEMPMMTWVEFGPRDWVASPHFELLFGVIKYWKVPFQRGTSPGVAVVCGL